MSRTIPTLAILPLAMSVAYPISATAADNPHNDEAILVTATRIATRVNTVLSDTTVIEREDIERSATATLTDLLAKQPGVTIVQTGGPGSASSLYIRGTNSSHALVLIDGQRVSSATTGATAIEHLPLEQIDRIEILRGPASSLYGADAIGGVIQVFTRRGSGSVNPNFSIGTGSHGTRTATLGAGGESGATRFSLAAGWHDSDGFSSVKSPSGDFFDIYNADRDGYTNKNVAGSLSHRFSSGAEIGANLTLVDTKKQFDSTNCDVFFTQCTADFDNRQEQNLMSFGANASMQVTPHWHMQVRLGRGTDKTTSLRLEPVANTITVDHFNTTQDQASWQNDFRTALGTVMGAVDVRKEKVDATKAFTVSSRTTKALVLGYQGRFGAHDLQSSGRIDDVQRLGTHRSHVLAYGYSFVPGLRAHVSVGRAFHAPTFNDLYWPEDPVNFFEGNPNLQPERGFNREAGIAYVSEHTTTRLVAYRNEVSGLLDYVNGDASTNFIGRYENLDRAVLEGATLTYSLKSGSWQMSTSADVLSARDGSTDRRLQRRPARAAQVALTRVLSAGEIGVHLSSTGHRYNDQANKQRLGGYTLVDLNGRYSLAPALDMEIKAGNVFDKDHVVARSDKNDYAVPGRTLFVGLRYKTF